MKQSYTIINLATILMIGFAACQDGNDFGDGYTPSLQKQETIPVVYHTSANSTLLTVKADATDSPQTIAVTSNEEWTASSSDESWCTVSPANGGSNGTVTVTVTNNPSTSPRSATITIIGVNSGDEKEVMVTQSGLSPDLSVSTLDLKFKHMPDGSQAVQVTCNEGWDAISDATWCKVENKTDTGFTVTAEQNLSFSKRTATITVTSDSGETVPIAVIQEANGIEREDYGGDEKKI